MNCGICEMALLNFNSQHTSYSLQCLLLVRHLGTNNEILFLRKLFSFMKISFKYVVSKCWPFHSNPIKFIHIQHFLKSIFGHTYICLTSSKGNTIVKFFLGPIEDYFWRPSLQVYGFPWQKVRWSLVLMMGTPTLLPRQHLYIKKAK